ncbi:MAG TPA: hypothetical protein VK165_08060 [Azonexus sp.]|nr:hypothetical protein [Azonexus sp.]
MQQFLDKPSIDFGAVRDGRRSMPLWMDIDLTAARSIAGNSALSINIAGNSFYVDQDTTNVGFATVHFQDTNLGNASAPIFVSPGFIGNVPFTQILIENSAQPGKRLRIFYGVDLDFQAGVNASISIGGTVSVSNALADAALTAGYGNVGLLAAATAVQVVAPAANVNGIVVHSAGIITYTGGTNNCALVAKNAAPATVVDGDVILMAASGAAFSAVPSILSKLNRIPAGKGLYFISTNAEAAPSCRNVAYTIL